MKVIFALVKKAQKNSETSIGFKPMTSVIPVRCPHPVVTSQKHSIHALKQTLRAFRSAVRGALENLETDEKKHKTKVTFRVEGNTGMPDCVIVS